MIGFLGRNSIAYNTNIIKLTNLTNLIKMVFMFSTDKHSSLFCPSIMDKEIAPSHRDQWGQTADVTNKTL